ncbi:MAG TPA: carbamoyltransferase HypF, partial [Phycisphaerales bacterium]|nr:carbamoyltransferase HypF [Phycisphaerales bacterium]
SGSPTTRISPDLPLCDDCLREMLDPDDRRYRYAYINCTNCGPRYSIIRSLPYDRPRTTMADWPLCDACRAEYENPADRRYHAQPVACPRCGPDYFLRENGTESARGAAAIDRAAAMLGEGRILAVKGIGGYHLACDARNDSAVLALRERKYRKEKPFAVMVSSLESARSLAALTDAHIDLLTGPARPIVLAPARTPHPLIAPDTDEIGLMLPYAPLHELLFRSGAPDPIVLTSANRSSEPIAYRDDDAVERMEGIADGFLIGERPIQRRVDDSVASVRLGRPFVIRRSRGYAPGSVASLEADAPILAVGADLKNTIALATGGEVFMSQHIGDLGDLETDRAFHETIDDLLHMYAVDRRRLIIAHDMHPEYASTRAALALDAPETVAVQHHEAHIAAVLLEHGLLDEPVIGVALDGTGFGRDGTIWGGEIFRGSIRDGFERVSSLTPVLMPGGDAAARHPVQACAAYIPDIDPAILEREPFCFPRRFRQSQSMIASGTRTIQSTSAGRVFDAAAAVCGFTREITYEGQAAIWLEHLARSGDAKRGPGLRVPMSTPGMIRSMVDARLHGAAAEDLAAWFHHALTRRIASLIGQARGQRPVSTVVLSGGVWQNRLLPEILGSLLPPSCNIIFGNQIPCNDAGISAGQIALAAR